MTEHQPGGIEPTVRTLQEVIRDRMRATGWSYGELARRSDGQLTRGRWQQLGTGTRMTESPEPRSVSIMAHALQVDETTVWLAVGRTLGLSIRVGGSQLAQMLPPHVDLLGEDMRDALLGVVRVAVAEAVARATDESSDATGGHRALRWTSDAAPSRGQNEPPESPDVNVAKGDSQL